MTRDDLIDRISKCTQRYIGYKLGLSYGEDTLDRIYQLRQSELLNNEDKEYINGIIKNKLQVYTAKEFIVSDSPFMAVYSATGTGKSRIPMYITSLSINLLSKTLIVVPTENLRDNNWPDEFKEANIENSISQNLKITCYASLNKIVGHTIDLVVLDEGHHITELNSEFFKNNIIKRCILLTATDPTNPEKKAILNWLGFKTLLKLSTDEAVRLGIINDYRITIVNLHLDNTIKYVGKKVKHTEREAYLRYTRSIFMAPNKFKSLARARIIYNSIAKEQAAKYILRNLIPQKKKVIIFCQSITQADKLSPYRYHSKTDDMDLIYFKDGSIIELSCVNALNEGENIPNLDYELIVQLNSTEKDFIQRMGRNLRFRVGATGNIIILCAIDTIDEEWVRSALRNIDKNKVTTIEYGRLIMGLDTINF